MNERLLVVQSGFLGDAVLASGMLRGIAAVAPAAEVGLVVRAEYAGLFEGYPGLRRLHRFDKRKKGGTAELALELRDAGYDMAFLPHRSFRSAYMVRRAGVARRIGFRQSDAPWMLTGRVEYNIALHETERNATLLAAGGIMVPAPERRMRLYPRREDLDRMGERFPDAAGVILLAPGSVWPTKRWTADGYAEVARRLHERERKVLLIGSGGELELCRRIAVEGGLPPENVLCGTLSLEETLALVAIAGRVITNDSAPLHLAESVGTPVTAIFGPTVPEFGFGPLAEASRTLEIGELPCRPCGIHGGNRCPIGTHECMRGISPERVLLSVEEGAGRRT